MPEYIFVGHVDTYIKQETYWKEMKEALDEIVKDGLEFEYSPHAEVGGILDYNKHRFVEYKVKGKVKSQNIRLFGLFYEGNLYVFGYGSHRGKEYDGIFHDKKKATLAKVSYLTKKVSQDELAEEAATLLKGNKNENENGNGKDLAN
jgi:hypothetical protein